MKKGRTYPHLRKYDEAILEDVRLFKVVLPWQLIAAHVPDPETGFYILRRLAKEGTIAMHLLEPERGRASRRVITLPGEEPTYIPERLQLYETVVNCRALGYTLRIAIPRMWFERGEEVLHLIAARGQEDEDGDNLLQRVKRVGVPTVALSDPNPTRALRVRERAAAEGIKVTWSPHYLERKHPRLMRQAPIPYSHTEALSLET